MLRSWQGCFLLTAIVFGLQLFPYTGVVLMMLAAPVWSVILINLGFALMARDAWRNPAERWLMLFPLLWFGGYFIVTSVSHWQAYRYVEEIAGANARRRIPFDPARQDIVIERNHNDETNGSALSAQTLVESFGLVRAFQREPDGPRSYLRYALLSINCTSSIVTNDRDGTTTIWLHATDTQGHRVSGARDLCTMQSSQPPELPIVHVRPQPRAGRYDDNRVSQDVAIVTPDGATIKLRSGWARPLAWLPQPVIGCALDSGTPAWRCFAAFQRQSLYDPRADRTPQAAEKVVAKALGLHRITIRQRYPNAGWR